MSPHLAALLCCRPGFAHTLACPHSMVVDRVQGACALAVLVSSARQPCLVPFGALSPFLICCDEHVCWDEEWVLHLWSKVIILGEVPEPVVKLEVFGIDVVELSRAEISPQSTNKASPDVRGDFVIVLVCLLNFKPFSFSFKVTAIPVWKMPFALLKSKYLIYDAVCNGVDQDNDKSDRL